MRCFWEERFLKAKQIRLRSTNGLTFRKGPAAAKRFSRETDLGWKSPWTQAVGWATGGWVKMGSSLQMLSLFQYITGCNFTELKTLGTSQFWSTREQEEMFGCLKMPHREKEHVTCKLVTKVPWEAGTETCNECFLGEFSREVGRSTFSLAWGTILRHRGRSFSGQPVAGQWRRGGHGTGCRSWCFLKQLSPVTLAEDPSSPGHTGWGKEKRNVSTQNTYIHTRLRMKYLNSCLNYVTRDVTI